MKTILLNEKYNNPISLALGFFDCIHLGHKKLIESCNNSKFESAIFTFSNDPASIFGGVKQIYNFDQRLKIFENLKVNVVISEEMTEDFSKLSPIMFLDTLFNNYVIKEINVGSDYTFGAGAKGNIELLKLYSLEHDCKLNVHPFEMDENSKKLSSRNIKELVINGEIEKINNYLSEPYCVYGKVFKARHEGTLLGYPTANILMPENMLKLGQGVYATKIEIDGKLYNSMTNVGSKPTFSIDDYSIETNIFDFNGDIYNKNVKIIFLRKTREVKKFDSPNELKEQLIIDEKEIKELLK